MSLITATEVLQYSPAEANFPKQEIERTIPVVEATFRRKCLGVDFYDWLVANQVDYSDVANFISDHCYNENEEVKYNEQYWISLADDNETIPSPTNQTWAKAPKYANSCVQAFWNNYLLPILATTVYKDSINTTTFRNGAAGLFTQESDSGNARGSNFKEIGQYKSSLVEQINTMTANMIFYLKENVGETGCGLPSDALNACSLCKQQGRRKFAFKH